MTRPDYQMTSHRALWWLLHCDCEFRAGSQKAILACSQARQKLFNYQTQLLHLRRFLCRCQQRTLPGPAENDAWCYGGQWCAPR